MAADMPLSLVVVVAHEPDRFSLRADEFAELARATPLAIAGAGATAAIAEKLGAAALDGDALAAADVVAAGSSAGT